jgi:DNA-binding transcriptional regulator YhcF (GntR family)
MELGVHFNTVGEAYRELANEGWLELRHGSGAKVVERRPPETATPGKLQEFRIRLRSLIAQVRAEGVPVAEVAAELRDQTRGLES